MQQDTSAGARNWSIELLRMAAMGMIVFQHLITHSDILNSVRGGRMAHMDLPVRGSQSGGELLCASYRILF